MVALARWLAEHPDRTPPMVRVRGRRYADLPFRQDRALAIPAQVFRPQWRDLDPHAGVDEISWRGDCLVIAGSAYVPSVDIGAGGTRASCSCCCRGAGAGRRWCCPRGRSSGPT